MVAQVTLDHSVWVRVLVPEPNGAMVKRLRRRPLKAKSRVRFPLALPEVNADAYASAFFYCVNYATEPNALSASFDRNPTHKIFLNKA